jgi:hypothetical protein
MDETHTSQGSDQWGDRRGLFWVAALVVALFLFVVGALSIWVRYEQLGIGVAGPSQTSSAIATNGIAGVLGSSTEGAALLELFRSAGNDLRPLEGHEIAFDVDARRVNAVAFWMGTPPDDVLVVIDRDVRTDVERQHSRPADRALTAPAAGTVTVRGIVTPVSYPEETYSWTLSRPDTAHLLHRGAYVRVTSVEPVRSGESAPPPAPTDAADGARPAPEGESSRAAAAPAP